MLKERDAQWDELPKRTKAPYELTHKSNGCIILIAALTPRDLLVTSKHSLGAVVGGGGGDGESPGPSHSQMGERWLERTLNAAKRTKRQLARELWLNNLTAVAELCDDSFEEHVLPYGPEQTGLHLHGLNRNTARFNTLPSADVQRFASEWGFIPTPFTTFDSVDSLRAYCDTVSKQGGIKRDNDDGDGPIEPVEGFVVRALKTDALNDGDYFFWKVKFDEPYLMYREWREITRKIIKLWEADARREASAVRPRTQDLLSPDPSSRFEARKLKNPLSRLYALWVERAYRLDPPAFDDWKQGRGIVATRERFLAWADSSPEALELKRRFNADLPTTDTASDTRPFEKTLVAPVAIPGLGKTFVGLALARVFGWPHVQSDDITFKKSGPHFVKAVSDSFEKSDVVIADKLSCLTCCRVRDTGLAQHLWTQEQPHEAAAQLARPASRKVQRPHPPRRCRLGPVVAASRSAACAVRVTSRQPWRQASVPARRRGARVDHLDVHGPA